MLLVEETTQLQLDRILVATDFGAAADAATNYAAALARHFGSTLTVAHVMGSSRETYSWATNEPRERMWRKSLEEMDRVIHRLNQFGVDVRSREIQAQHPAGAIIGLAELSNTDLVILGTTARLCLDEPVLGSCAENIIRHASCPVITVGPKATPLRNSEFSLKTVVFATDMHHQEVEKAALTLAFAKKTLARVYICHVQGGAGTDELGLVDIESESELALLRVVPPSVYDWCNIEYIVRSGKPSEQILDVAKAARADLIVLGARRESAWDAPHLTEGVVERVLAEAECPVMTLCLD